jgi:anti-sigma B factor antagonist
MTPVSVSAGADGSLRVVLRGEIDYTNAAPVTEIAYAAIQQARPQRVVVDLTAVTFLDSSGIGVLVSGMKAARSVGAEYRVSGADPKVADQLEITGLAELFPIDPRDDDSTVDRTGAM